MQIISRFGTSLKGIIHLMYTASRPGRYCVPTGLPRESNHIPAMRCHFVISPPLLYFAPDPVLPGKNKFYFVLTALYTVAAAKGMA